MPKAKLIVKTQGISGGVRHLFAERLRELREAEGLSQEELALRAGLHRNYVGRLERASQSPSLEVIVKLAIALKVAPAALLSNLSKVS